MPLHQYAAAKSRARACRSVPFPGRKARILSNDFGVWQEFGSGACAATSHTPKRRD
jgi:hypothetical protein